MKTDKKIKQIAKEIIRKSSRAGQLDEKLFLNLTKKIFSSGDFNAKPLLKELLRLVSQEERKDTLIVESAFELELEFLEKLKKLFEKKEKRLLKVNFSLNKELISGLKVTLGNSVWENSVISNLENLKGKLSYE